MTAVIEASSAGVKDMADGSLRITFEFEPRHAAEAFALFGPRGRAVAIAALKDGAAKVPDIANPISDKPKGGEWAKLAGIWCNSPHFWEFANGRAYQGVVWLVEDAHTAKGFIYHLCDIESRKALDNDPEALARFNAAIRRPFMEWMKVRGVEIDQREHA